MPTLPATRRTRRLRELGLRLTEPSPTVAAPEARRRARLLAAMLLLMLPASLLASLASTALVAPAAPGPDPLALLGPVAACVGLGLYVLSRTRHHEAAAALTVLTACAATWASVALSRGTPHAAASPYFLGLGVLLSSVLLSPRWTVALALGNLAAVLALPRVWADVDYFDVANVGVFLLLVSAIIVVFAAVRSRDLRQMEVQAVVLAEKEERLRSIVDNAPDLIALLDRAGTVRYLNRSPGAPGGLAAGADLREALAEPAERARLTRLLEGVFATGVPAGFEFQAPDGRAGTVWWSARLGPVFRAGQVVAATLIATDVSALKAAEGERARSLARAAEIEQLREVARFKTNFINMAAHELRTPMTPIKTQLFLLKRRRVAAFDREEREAFASLERNVQRLGDLLKDLLDGARLQAGRLDLRLQPTDLGALARDAVAAHREHAAQAGVEVEVRAPGPVPVRADPMRLGQVAMNLVSNAVKFTPAGGRVVVEAAVEEGQAVLRVRDTGVGFGPEDLAQLFQPFSQLRFRTDNGTSEGSGLGLYISKDLVERQGGQLACASEGPGRGATFTVRLPAAAAEAAAPVAA